jgi:hypothetical protein
MSMVLVEIEPDRFSGSPRRELIRLVVVEREHVPGALDEHEQ